MIQNYPRGQFLAPMVRVCLLPSRLLALEYGADVVYTEETIDKKMIGSVRIWNERLGTYDYMREGRVMFRTVPHEKDRLIFQMGTANPQLALKCALADDVAQIDVNCGCPKPFSVHAGMGAALLKTPDLLVEILETLVKYSGKPVSCKIRIFDELDDTIALVKRLETTGICAIAVHCRTAKETKKNKAHWDVLRHIVDAVKIPVIANGDMFSRKDIEHVLNNTGVHGVMIARAAQHNMSIFRHSGLLKVEEVARRFVEYAIQYDNPYQNCKYCILTMNFKFTPDQSVALSKCKSLADLCAVMGWDDLAQRAREAAEQRKLWAEAASSSSQAADNEELYDDLYPSSYIPQKEEIPTPVSDGSDAEDDDKE